MRFVQEVVRSGFKCLRAEIRIARNHYDGNFDTVHPQHSDEVRSRHAAHAMIRNNKVGAVCLNVLECQTR